MSIKAIHYKLSAVEMIAKRNIIDGLSKIEGVTVHVVDDGTVDIAETLSINVDVDESVLPDALFRLGVLMGQIVTNKLLK